MKRYFIFFILLFLITPSYASEIQKHPDFSTLYLGFDRFEKFNRKMFNFNISLNKFVARPVCVLWTSVMPKYGIERLKYAYSNILYPRRVISSVVQKDFKAAGQATVRFITNSTVGIAGMFDPAKRFMKIKPINEDMEQAFAKYGMKQGPYLVLPVITSTTPRGLLGLACDCALDPTSYIGSSVIAAIKAVFTINNLSDTQSGIKNLKNSYKDSYDIAKKIYGIKIAILNANLDRDEVIEQKEKENLSENNNILNVNSEIQNNLFQNEVIQGSATEEDILYDELIPDIILKNYNSKHPIIDSMRTALFEIEGVNTSFWADTSFWNHSFQKRIKLDSVSVYPDRDDYKFRYITQKDKNSPLVIIFPSIGENIYSHHSDHFAKLFYDEGYSILILSSAFTPDFYNSMPENYTPGVPFCDVKYLKETISKILNKLENSENCKFEEKIVFGTSYGGMSALFLGDLETKEEGLNISKYISINPPYDLLYAINKIDESSENIEQDEEKLKDKVTFLCAKVLKLFNLKEENEKFEELPFNIEEAKLITSFIMHQKLSDLIFALEGKKEYAPEFYKEMQSMNYADYSKKYIKNKDFKETANLSYIKNYLETSKNYKIYHTLDDYLISYEQLKKLKKLTGKNMRLIDKGAHLGFLYRSEFLDDLKKEITLKGRI